MGLFVWRMAGGNSGMRRCAPGLGRFGGTACAHESFVSGGDLLASHSGGIAKGARGMGDFESNFVESDFGPSSHSERKYFVDRNDPRFVRWERGHRGAMARVGAA